MSCCAAILAVCLILVRLITALRACTSPDGSDVCSCSGTSVYCNYRNIATVPDDIPASTTYLSISRNQIVTIQGGKFQHLQNLTELYLDNNKINTIESHTFIGLQNLQQLYLYNNNISVVEPGSFQHLQSLTELRLDYNNLTALPSDTFATLYSLTLFYLSNNQIETLNSDIFAGLNQLEYLYLSYNLMDVIPSSVAKLTSLREFNMAHNEITALQPDIFSNRNIEGLTLDLSYNNITILEEGTFSNITYYYNGLTINLRGNPIKKLDMYSFSNIDSRYWYFDYFILDLSNMQLEMIHEDAFANMLINAGSCWGYCGVYLSNNHLETLPPNLCDLPYDVPIDLSNNPWSCDCRMREILDCSNLNYEITCQSPPALNEARLYSLTRDNLTCSSPALTHASPTVHQAEVGETVTLYCNATGFNRPSLTWSWTPVQPSSEPTEKPHYDIYTTKLGYNSVQSTLTIIRVQMSYQGHYTCHASNAAGDDLRSFSLFVIPAQTETPPPSTGNSKESTHSSGTLIGAAVGSFVGGILLCAIICFIVYMRKRKQADGCLPRTSSSQDAEAGETNSRRGTEHSNPAYEDVGLPQRSTENRQEPVTSSDAEAGETNERRGTEHSNPAYEDVGLPRRSTENRQEPVTSSGGQDGRPDMGKRSRVGNQRPQLGLATDPGTSTSHLYQDLQQETQVDHVYTSLQKEHVS